MASEPPTHSLETQTVHGGHHVDPLTGAIVPPIHTSTTYARDSDYRLIGDYLYGRHGLPTYRPVEELAARLDGGEDALLFGSGLAGFTAVVETVPPGGGVVAPRVMYYGAQEWLRRLDSLGRIKLTLFDQRRPTALSEAVAGGNTHLVWIETPVNPTWDVIDIGAAARAAHGAGGRLAVDSTAAPLTTRPIELGADLTFHSATKFYNGHSDVGGGIVVTAKADEQWAEVIDVRKHQGGVIGAFEAWLLLRGMRTLYLRVDRASESALALARHFEGHPGVDAVLYPGLESHPGHLVAKSQMTRGFGAMMSIRVADGQAAARTVATSTRVFVPATSLGCVESLIEHRVALEPPESVVPDDLLRLSIGIEPVDDLIADLERALDAARG
jgi:cystathionine gamma-synthase